MQCQHTVPFFDITFLSENYNLVCNTVSVLVTGKKYPRPGAHEFEWAPGYSLIFLPYIFVLLQIIVFSNLSPATSTNMGLLRPHPLASLPALYHWPDLETPILYSSTGTPLRSVIADEKSLTASEDGAFYKLTVMQKPLNWVPYWVKDYWKLPRSCETGGGGVRNSPNFYFFFYQKRKGLGKKA